MKVFIGILIGISLMFAIQKIWKEKERSENDTVATTTVTTTPPTQKDQIPPDFLIFYSQFHNDSTFQMQHIDFPLDGIPNYADSLTLVEKNFRWQEEDWELHKLTERRKESFHEDLVILEDWLINEFISVGQGEKQLWMERRFMKSGGEWRLIYFSGLNKMN